MRRFIGLIKNSLFYVILFLLPKNCLSRLMGRLAEVRLPREMMSFVIKAFSKRYQIDLSEALKPIEDYASLQDFFIRRLKPGARTISSDQSVVISPCDGTLSMEGPLKDGLLIQAKGRHYSLLDLLRDKELGRLFLSGHYATIYLAPRDYHRFHAPMEGIIEKTIYVPGTLWPVNNWAVDNIRHLFCQNERVITIIKCPIRKRRLAHIAVGATMVGKIELEYCDISGQNTHRGNAITTIAHDPVFVSLGQELGKFMFGSTIILLWEPGLIDGLEKDAKDSVKMGETLSKLPIH